MILSKMKRKLKTNQINGNLSQRNINLFIFRSVINLEGSVNEEINRELQNN